MYITRPNYEAKLNRPLHNDGVGGAFKVQHTHLSCQILCEEFKIASKISLYYIIVYCFVAFFSFQF